MTSDLKIRVLKWGDLFARYAMSVLANYLTDIWKLNLTHAVGIVNIWTGLASTLPVAFFFLLQAGMSSTLMLLLSSIAYTIGLGFLFLSTPPILSNLSGPCPECISETQKILFYIALSLIALGMAGYVVSQIDRFISRQQTSSSESETDDDNISTKIKEVGIIAFFIIAMVGGIAIQYIKPWSLRFGIPAICTLVATLIFASRSCRLRDPEAENHPGLITTSVAGVVEEAKTVSRMVPMWVSCIICGVVSSIGNTYFIQQADHMDRKLGKIKVPLTVLVVYYEYTKASATAAFEDYFKKESRRRGKTIPAGTGIVTAILFSVLCCITAAKVETRRLEVIGRHGLVDKPDDTIPMSMFWLVIPYSFLAVVDGIFEPSMELFFKQQAPQAIRGNPSIVTKALIGLGTMGSVLSTYTVNKASQQSGKPSWFQNTLNQSRLDNYYWTLAVISSLNFFLCFAFSCIFPYRGIKARLSQAIEICLIGLENAGKSSLANVIASGEYSESTKPTVGLNSMNVTNRNVQIKLTDLGGQPKFRSMWEGFCRSVHAIIYVVDAVDHEKLSIARSELQDLLSKPSLSGIPLLVLGNKIDEPGAVSQEAFTEQMGLNSITDREQCCFMISCKNSTNVDSVIDWLVKHSKSTMGLHFDSTETVEVGAS